MYLNATAFTLTVDTEITDATNALTVVVGSTSLAFADATTQTARNRIWFNPGFSWTAGTAVSIRIPDTTPPELTSAAVAADGNSITVTFDESVDQTNLPAAGAFSVAADGAPVTVSGVSAGTAAQLVLALAAPGIRAGQVVTLGYTDPTDGDDTSAVQDTSGNDAVSFSDYSVTNNSIVVTVPSDWSLKPTGLAVGAKFRLLFLSSTKRDGSSSDIADYHAFIQTRAAAGHADIRTYSTGFRALGCTSDVDARDTTYTTYTSTDKGVPIYWLNGAKAADQYEDFYDGTWDDEVNDKNESGTNGPNTSLEANYPLTGCNDRGTEYFDRFNRSSALAKIEVMVGRPNSSAAASHGPLSSNTALDVSNTVTRPMYGLSAIFQVAADTTPPTLTSADVEETNGLTIYLEFSEDLQLSNPPLASAFTLTVDGSAVTGFSVALPGSLLPQNAIWLRPPTAIRQGQAVVVTYTDPTAGNDTAAIQDTTGNDAADFTTGMNSVPAVINNSTVANAVLAGWSLTPTGLAVGDQFRLLFLSSTKRDATATDIATYNTFIQTRAAAGHADIQAYSAGFRALGCTSDGRGTMRGGGVDARDNTETTYISTAKGVPIYWLNGAKAADEYEDFYDGSWDDEANDKNESGTDAHDTSQTANWPWTGCNHNGTELRRFAGAVSRGLGTTVGIPNEVRYGRPDSSTVDHGPLNGLQNGPKAENRPLYGLSALFQVAAAGGVNNPPTVATAIPDQSATAGTAFSYVFPANTFSDADTGDTLSYTATKTDDTALPTWLAFAAGTRTFSGTPQAADAGTVSVEVTASDGNGGSVSDTFDITVAADTTPPTLTSATVTGGGTHIELQFSENIPLLTQPPGSAFTVTADGVAVTTPFSPTWAHPSTPDLLRLQVSPVIIFQGQAVVVTYTDPTAGDDANAIQDTAGNDAATFTTGMNGVPAVTNNSTATNTPATGAPTITGTAQVGQTLTAVTTGIMDDDGLNNVSYTYQWIRTATGTGVDTNISGATASTYTLVAADLGTTIKVRVSFTDDASNAETLTSAATAAVSAVVPSNWTLKPTAVAAGAKFRLLFLSSTRRNASSTDIATYNTFIQTRAANGHADIRDYSAGFRAVGCTAAVDARDNTATTYTTSDKGVPIYWLNGAKAADQYEDFYDGSWDDEANDKNESGTNGLDTSLNENWPLTGCDHDGTAHAALGASQVTRGRPNSSGSGHGPLNGNDQITSGLTSPLYGLSAIFQVAAAVVVPNNPPTFSADTAARSVAENTAAGQNVGAVLTATDADSDTLIYTLEGADAASFGILSASGQIQTRTGVTYNHEAKSTYTVIVKADDSNGGTDTVTVTITVTDVNEPPGRPAAPSVSATAGSTTSLDVTWTAPTNTGPAIASYDLQYRAGTSGNFTNGPQNVTGTSAAIGSLAADTSYEVQVRATNAEGDGDWSVAGTGRTTATSAPGAPTGLSATASGTTAINLSWTAPASTGGSAITGYKIEVSPNGTSGWTDQVADTNSTATTYAHTGLAAGDTRHYRVSAINTNGAGTASNVDSATTGTSVPGAPTGLTATASGATQIDLSWSAPGSTGGSAITGYKIEVSPNGTSGWTDQVANTNSTATTYAHTGLASGDTRHYRVSAINANGAGTASNVATATTGTTVPGAPTGLTTTASGTTQIDLSWTAPASTGGSAITGYNIEVSPNGISSWTDQVANTNSTATTYAHTGLAAGDTRHYRVSAINTNGAGTASNVDSATTGTTVPGAPTGLTTTASGTTQIDLSWTAPASTGGSAITGYNIEVSPNGTSGWTNLVANTNSTATTYAHTGLAAGDTRHYRVSAINTNGAGTASNVDSATTGTTAPGAPTGLTATASGTTADRPLLDRPGEHRRLRHHRLQDRIVLRWRLVVVRPGRQHQQHRHDLRPHRACLRRHPPLPRLRHQRQRRRHRLQRRQRHHRHHRARRSHRAHGHGQRDHPDRPLLDRPGQHRRLRHHRLQHRGLLRWRLRGPISSPTRAIPPPPTRTPG